MSATSLWQWHPHIYQERHRFDEALPGYTVTPECLGGNSRCNSKAADSKAISFYSYTVTLDNKKR